MRPEACLKGDSGLADIREQIVAHLPYLRRYARMLTGSQEAGDDYVARMLEAVIADPSGLASTGSMRLELFTRFHAVAEAPEAGSGTVPPEPNLERRLEAGLSRLPSKERRALLLTSVEGFSIPEVARILAVSEEEARALVRAAREDLSRQTTANILIIEDDAIIALNNAEIVREMGHRVTGTAAREQEAVDLVEQTSPDLILADIQLAEGDSGIRAVQKILTSTQVPVIFVTGFPERLLTGHTLEPAFVITKPFDPETLRTAIAHALSTRQ